MDHDRPVVLTAGGDAAGLKPDRIPGGEGGGLVSVGGLPAESQRSRKPAASFPVRPTWAAVGRAAASPARTRNAERRRGIEPWHRTCRAAAQL